MLVDMSLYKLCMNLVLVFFTYLHFRFVSHILNQATKFAESPHPSNSESALNSIWSCVIGVIATQDDTKADIIELNVRLAEEKDGRENTE
jgi:hypothetical protein